MANLKVGCCGLIILLVFSGTISPLPGLSARALTVQSSYPKASLNRWLYLTWYNQTSHMINSSFPFVVGGASLLTNESTNEQLLSGAYLYMLTGNISVLSYPELVCRWLNATSTKKHLWFDYDLASQTWASTQYASVATGEIRNLAIYALLVPKWTQLLQTLVNEFIRIFIPLSTARIHFSVYSNDNVPSSDFTPCDYQCAAITTLTLTSVALNNMTLKNIAYRMILNYTLGAANLPPNSIYQNGTLRESYTKEDEDFAAYMAAMESFYYYYPANTTIKNRIKTVAVAGSSAMWNPHGYDFFDYRTNSTTGIMDPSWSDTAVHGFGMTDEVLMAAYLIWGNSTWLTRARADFDSLVLQGKIVYSGLIAHSTAPPFTSPQDDASEGWNVHARRTAVLFYNIFNNATYLHWANMLFWNVTGKMAKQYGIVSEAYCTTGVGEGAGANTRVGVETLGLYLNKTQSFSRFSEYVFYFGLPTIGLLLPNALLGVIISPTSVTMDVGQSQIFTSNAIAETPPYFYKWYLNGGSVGTNSTYLFKPTKTGSYSLYCNVTDSTGKTSKSNMVAITVYAVPELPLALAIIIFIVTALFAIILLARKRNQKKE